MYICRSAQPVKEAGEKEREKKKKKTASCPFFFFPCGTMMHAPAPQPPFQILLASFGATI